MKVVREGDGERSLFQVCDHTKALSPFDLYGRRPALVAWRFNPHVVRAGRYIRDQQRGRPHEVVVDEDLRAHRARCDLQGTERIGVRARSRCRRGCWLQVEIDRLCRTSGGEGDAPLASIESGIHDFNGVLGEAEIA